jgi:hypothetical protein
MGTPHFVKISSVDSMPDDYLWFPLPSAKVNVDIPFTKLRTTVPFNDNYYGRLKDVLHTAKWLGWEGKFVFFGPQAIKRFADDLDDSMNLETYIMNKIEEQKDTISVQIGASEGTSLNVLDSSVYDLLNIPKPSRNSVPDTLRRYFKIADIALEVTDYSHLEEKYPMLFSNKITEDTIKDYINLVNNK